MSHLRRVSPVPPSVHLRRGTNHLVYNRLDNLRVDLAKAQAAVASVTTRAETRAELRAERDRKDVWLAQLHEQLAQLIARKPTSRPADENGAVEEEVNNTLEVSHASRPRR